MRFDEWWKNFSMPVEKLSWINIKDVPEMIARAAWYAALTNTVSSNATNNTNQADRETPCSCQKHMGIKIHDHLCPNYYI